ncbi:DUF202 domain-containing protein [Pseudomonas jessenii]|uniref:DUF202 domain-containing protein n=1 Tax=Pseudomonas jessenii TaxID=77298 RepID=UPI0039E0265E
MSDTGLQPERTLLAWRRTQMLLVLVACLALRCLQHHRWLMTGVVAMATLQALLIILEQGRSYGRARNGIAGHGLTCNPLSLLVLCLCSALLATVVLYAVVAQN